MEPKERDEIVFEYLETVDVPFTLEDLFEETGLKKNRRDETEIHQLLMTIDEFVEDDGTFYPKVTFLKDIPIRISPTEFEIKNDILIPGHRILPFHPTGAPVDYVSMTYKGKPVKTRKINLQMRDLQIYFSLMDLQKLPILNIEDLLEEGADLHIQVCDLKQFYKTNRFKSGDTIILRSEDFEVGLFSMSYESYEDTQTNIFEIKKVDRIFLKTLKQILEQDIYYPNVEKQLLYTYYALSDMEWGRPGTALGPLLGKNSEIAFSPLPNGRTIFHFVDQDIEDLAVYPDFDNMPELDEEEFDLDTIEGLLRFLNNNNNITIVRALIFDMIANKQRYSYTKIEQYLFDGLPKPYMPPEFRQRFKELISREHKQIKKAFNLKYAYLPVSTARERILEQCLNISRFLRSLDENMVALQDLPKSEMMHLMELDRVFEEILEELERIQLEGRSDVSEVHRVLKLIEKVSGQLPGLFTTIRQKLDLV